MSAERDHSGADAVSDGRATKAAVDAMLGVPHPTASSQQAPTGPVTPDSRFAELQRLTSAYMDEQEEAMLARAYAFASKAHAGQCRKSGEP
ncbi:MAG: GTP pyrophosphokinase, partial [Eggerthellaceae bacterium]|nr:GTP pyrophosphokinase [Eggerthellaceae bacterium]